jgi:response regulator RpfG family c-di-GMP phosphodiesterase
VKPIRPMMDNFTVATPRVASRANDEAAVRLAELAGAPTVERAVDAVREFLGMEVAFIGQITAESEILRVVRGDGDSFGFAEGKRIALEETYCQRILRGRLPNLITDVRADDRARSLRVTTEANVGAFVSIPLNFSSGLLYGMLCAASHDPKPGLGYRELQFLNVFARMVCDVLEREELQRCLHETERRVHESELHSAAVGVLLAALDSRDSYTGSHSKAVVDHAVAVAKRLGLAPAEIADVRDVATLHDVGKLAIPDAILHKPGPLTEDEWVVMRTHPMASEQLLAQVPSLHHLCGAIRAEHERWDGTGYPDGLAGPEIPLASRITLVCDAFHAMTSERPYRHAMSLADTCAEIEAGSGTQFCPTAAGALVSIVRNASERTAPVFHQARCECLSCGAHTVSNVGYKVAGQCPNCKSFELAELLS